MNRIHVSPDVKRHEHAENHRGENRGMKNSRIEWTDHTFNPWIGCTKVSPGCLNCYAETLNKRWHRGVNWGKGAPRKRTSEAYWNEPLKWNHDAALHEALCLANVTAVPPRPRVFCASLADWLDSEVPLDWLADLLLLIKQTPALDWLLLTKRPENFHERLQWATMGRGIELPDWILGWTTGNKIPENVWVGTSIEDQTRADKRIPELLNIPADVHFLSCEPLLGPVDLMYPESLFPGGPKYCCAGIECNCGGQPIDPPLIYGIDWVIVGGESGVGARAMRTEWAESIALQLKGTRTKFFMKQLGGVHDKRHALEDFPESLRVREFPT